jgi:hypothetical protein
MQSPIRQPSTCGIKKDIIIRSSILISIYSSQKQNLCGLPAREMWVKISTLFAAQADEIEQ